MIERALALALLAVTLGCPAKEAPPAAAKTPPPTEAPASPAAPPVSAPPASASPVASAEPAPPALAPELATKAMAPFLGKWSVRLTPQQENQLLTMRLAFEPKDPSPDRLNRLSKEEQGLMQSIREAWKRNPTDRRLQEMKAVVEGMSKSTLEVTTSTLTLVVGGIGQAASYSVIEAAGPTVTVNALAKSGKLEKMSLTQKSPKELELRKLGEGDPLTFIKK